MRFSAHRCILPYITIALEEAQYIKHTHRDKKH